MKSMKSMKGRKNLKGLRNQAGATVLELLLWSVGAIVIIALGAYAFIRFQENNRVGETTRQLVELTAVIKGLYPEPNYNGVSPAQIVQAKKAPSSMASGSTLINKFGGTVLITATAYNGGVDNAFSITYPGVPTSECNSVLSSVQQNFVEIRVGSTVIKDAATTLSSAAVTTACANPTNTLLFVGV